jgi:hypothetical protein
MNGDTMDAEYPNHAVAYADGWADAMEFMRSAGIAAIEAMPGIGSFMPGRGSTLSRASVIEALREVQP